MTTLCQCEKRRGTAEGVLAVVGVDCSAHVSPLDACIAAWWRNGRVFLLADVRPSSGGGADSVMKLGRAKGQTGNTASCKETPNSRIKRSEFQKEKTFKTLKYWLQSCQRPWHGLQVTSVPPAVGAALSHCRHPATSELATLSDVDGHVDRPVA